VVSGARPKRSTQGGARRALRVPARGQQRGSSARSPTQARRGAGRLLAPIPRSSSAGRHGLRALRALILTKGDGRRASRRVVRITPGALRVRRFPRTIRETDRNQRVGLATQRARCRETLLRSETHEFQPWPPLGVPHASPRSISGPLALQGGNRSVHSLVAKLHNDAECWKVLWRARGRAHMRSKNLANARWRKVRCRSNLICCHKFPRHFC